VRLERSESLVENREQILHNAVAKYLVCRRQIWPNFRPTLTKTGPALGDASIEFILQTILRRRLNQGFGIAYGRNGIIHLVRERTREDLGSTTPQIEQCIVFGPTISGFNEANISSMHVTF